jgi:integration host factor subunit beta
MTKSELIEALANKQPHLTQKDVDLAVDSIIEQMCQALIANDRIEIRGFGAFSLHYHPARVGRNPKTGESLQLPANYLLHFKPGKDLRDRVDQSRLTYPIRKGVCD